MFKKVNPKLDLPKAEEDVLEFWQKNDIFKKSLAKNKGKKNFVFYEGPPTANGRPGLHHVEARSFKDLFPRYKTMQGYMVWRKAGWDTHGLPVELEVEKSLGISGKGEIENLVPGDKKASIAKFNQLCRESVWKYKSEWEWLTQRMGYWLDLSDPYITYDPKYIETVWWAIGEIDKRGLLYRGHKVVPYCPRCGTALSSHEVALGYKEVVEESVYVKLESEKEPGTYFLVWTTTPWTLPGNAALSLGPNIDYQIVEYRGDKLVIARNRVGEVLSGALKGDKDSAKILGSYSGREVIEKYSRDDQRDYKPLYPEGEEFAEAGEKIYKLILADFVSDTDGTGVVHTAPAFGEDDYIWGHQKNNIKVLKTVDEKGTLLAGAGQGSFVKDADSEIKVDLTERNLLFKREEIAHDYPFCWRCDSPLLYFARDSWYIAMSKLRDRLLANNKKINWIPGHLKEGRFGNWLENINDWAISRDRYWGTPLPIWECGKCKAHRVVTSLGDVGDIDPHKPQIDEVVFDCSCGGQMKRVAEVMDVWLDSGVMPYAQWHYPFENKELIDCKDPLTSGSTARDDTPRTCQFPADFIAEAVDQTRGWFYTLLAVSTAISDEPAYKNVISLGHLLDEHGKKMSKSKGNIVFPREVFDKYGADAARMFFYSVNQPGDSKLYSDKEMVALSRNFFLTLWNVYSFFVTYASIDKFSPAGKTVSKNVLDRWITARFRLLASEVTEDLNRFETYRPARAMSDFVAELSTWYVRRSRRRFWKTEDDEDKKSAYETLYYVLSEFMKLSAPFTPMFAEKVYLGLRQESDPESVHLTDFPKKRSYDSTILAEMANVRQVVERGLSRRAEQNIKIRQPLKSLTYSGKKLDANLEEIIKEEVNVKAVIWQESGDVELDFTITPELKQEGLMRELIRNIQSLRKESGFEVEDRIMMFYETSSSPLTQVLEKKGELIASEILAKGINRGKFRVEGEKEYDIDGEKIWVGLSRTSQKFR
ncbi:MAG: isoleucine--tRNA ligase [Patescibacteria group bacterium]